jgi:anti-anti-sigma regulatory factor
VPKSDVVPDTATQNLADVTAEIMTPAIQNVILDFSSVMFIDSVGVSVVQQARLFTMFHYIC